MKIDNRPAAQVDSIECAQCGEEASPTRRFCGKCGELLWDPCLACETVNPVDEQFCGSCGVDIFGDVQAAQENLSQTLAEADRQAKEGLYLDAATALQELPQLDHSRLLELSDQVRQRIDLFQEERLHAIEKSRCLADEARSLIQKGHFPQAFERLCDIPPAFRNNETKTLLEETELVTKEINRLRKQIKSALQQSDYKELLPKVGRLRELDASDAALGPLHEKLRQRQEKKNDALAGRLAQLAKAAIAKCDYQKAAAAIQKLDEISARSKEVEELLPAIKERIWLAKQLRTEPYVTPMLQKIAHRLLKLQPHDQHHAEVKKQLDVRRKISKKEGKMIPWAKSSKSSLLDVPIAPLALPAALVAAHSAERPSAQAMLIAYGLALQGLGMARVDLNLAPVVKKRSWLNRFAMSNKKSSPQAAWGIDVGSKYLKAVRLATDETQRNVRVVQSCVLPIYKTSDVENDLAAMQANVIAKFLKKHSLDGDVVVINIPSAQTLYRCFDLPAPKPKKFFEAVEYELRSRIPTDIDQLVLDFHWEELAPTDQDRTPQRRVVLVAAKKADAEKRLEKLPGQDPSQIMLQSDGVALANVTNYLLQTVDSDETIATLEIGSETSNLVIQSKNTVWFRALYHGTHAFDKIIATALKKTVRDAELLRLNLEKSPVMYQLHGMLLAEFSKIADELQRSISRYQNEFGESISQVYLCGAGSEQHGLLRFLQTGK